MEFRHGSGNEIGGSGARSSPFATARNGPIRLISVEDRVITGLADDGVGDCRVVQLVARSTGPSRV